jgi:hypothetical protein
VGARFEFSFDFFDPVEVGVQQSSSERVQELELAPSMGELGFALLGFVEDCCELGYFLA